MFRGLNWSLEAILPPQKLENLMPFQCVLLNKGLEGGGRVLQPSDQV